MEYGMLYIVATPIGNLEDITFRAVRTLQEVDLIAAEDTRTTGLLLRHYNITKPMVSYFEHNERTKSASLVHQLKAGKHIALVSEAGTPGMSDPGYRVISEAIANGIRVVPIPGPCAAIAALVVTGLPMHRFVFEGFLPPKSGKRKKHLQSLAGEERTLVFYESPYRIVQTLEDMHTVFGDRRAVITRELTKYYEEIMRGMLSELVEKMSRRAVKGEITLVVQGAIRQ
ncbi:MAG: 16S rRNA (cytidine(1402)-2'-O)-methyltransferase [Desulfobacterota bacterium]|nr:16S rRNA (cytidine(1402)-2'-O)-methyltransferase [Thermodesulfobacteriota bacterium]